MDHSSQVQNDPELNGSDMRPTMKCQIISTKDALILVQRCLQGLLQPITRRPHDRERTELVQPGNVFVYTESESGIKRWTDGVNWSPSRILNNFLVYRELDKAFPPGEKKKAAKRTKRYTPYDRNSPGNRLPQQNNSANGEGIVVDGAHRLLSKDEERMLVGSLNESYCFKKDGLIKKTISITHNNQTWHVVWYYSYLAFLENKFPRPEHCWPNTVLSPELTGDQNFRCPLNPDGTESSGSNRDRHHDSITASPPSELDAYHPIHRYQNLGHAGSQYLALSRPQPETHYQTSHYGLRSEADNTFYTTQQPRYAAAHGHEYAALQSTDYPALPTALHGQEHISATSVRFGTNYYNAAGAAPQLPALHSPQAYRNTNIPQYHAAGHLEYDARVLGAPGAQSINALGASAAQGQTSNASTTNPENMDQRYSWTRS